MINPYDLVEEYGTDAVRYYLLRHVHSFEDSDMTLEKFKEAYNANLANGLGNLVQRVMKMVTSYGVDISHVNFNDHDPVMSYHRKHIEAFDINKVMDELWSLIADLDSFVAREEPFKKVKTSPEEAHKDLQYLAEELGRLSISLYPVLPDTAARIQECLSEVKVPDEPLFVRKD